MKYRKVRTFVGDFETTVYDGQTSTEVWASACVELNTEDVQIFNNINDQFEYFFSQPENIICYYHNLKFDGAFWLSYLMIERKFKLAYDTVSEDSVVGKWRKNSDMENNTFSCVISDKGMWYSITIKYKNRFLELRDSLKLLPFSVRKIGKSFKTKHQKLDIEYKGERHAYGIITNEEKSYIANDVLVIKEALEIMFNDGHNKLTIGSCCLEEFKKTYDKKDFQILFPKLTEIELPKCHNYPNADSWIRRSYKGGWCYVVKGKENQVKHKGVTADVNSLYPSMMSSESGNVFPYGKPNFWYGNYIDDEALKPNRYFFIRIKTRFYLKKGKLPFIQIKGNHLYRGTEALESSDVYDTHDKTKKSSRYIDENGEEHDTRVELTLTMTDYYLFIEHYDTVQFEIIDGCWFYARSGLFDEYMEKWKKIKIESTGAIRELAKLFLNNLYGKMASSTDSSFKIPFIKDGKIISFYSIPENDKEAGYIAVGSAITSYARNFTIRAAQANYYGVNKRGFIYADTDSMHCDLLPEEVKGITVHPTNFCCWKLESCWDEAIFVRQKTYIEHVTHEDLNPIEKPYYNVKCAGMPSKCKELFLTSMQGFDKSEWENEAENEREQYTEEELQFLETKRKLTDFKIGLVVPGKLMPKRISGGILLVDTTYEMR